MSYTSNIKLTNNFAHYSHLLKEGNLVYIIFNKVYNFEKIIVKVDTRNSCMVPKALISNHKGYQDFGIGERLYLSNINIDIILKASCYDVFKELLLTQYD